jgi:hypothetical protein
MEDRVIMWDFTARGRKMVPLVESSPDIPLGKLCDSFCTLTECPALVIFAF